jgi:hypothetical protein
MAQGPALHPALLALERAELDDEEPSEAEERQAEAARAELSVGVQPLPHDEVRRRWLAER